MATGDFDGNGRLDLAIANQAGQSVTVLRFNPSGAPTSLTLLLGGHTPTGLTAAELSCIAGLDLAVSTSNSTIKILNNSGSGTFALVEDFNNIAEGSPAVVAADFNGDGRPSIAGTTASTTTPGAFDLASRSSQQSSGDGCGGYPGQDTLQSVGNQPAGMALGSFNTIPGGVLAPDAFADILAANAGAGTVSVLLYNGEAPQGGAPGGILTVLSQTVAVGAGPRAITTGQFNPATDTHMDFAVVCAGDRTLRVFLGTGRGTFNPGPVIRVNPGPVAIASGNLLADGADDLVVVCTGALPSGVNPSFAGVGNLGTATPSSAVNGICADGTAVVGQSASASGPQAFRWTQAGGIAGLGDLAGGTFDSSAAAASDNGSVVVGRGVSSASGAGFEAFRCVPPATPVGLGDLLPNPVFSSQAAAISEDGLVIAGTGTSAAGSEAFRWTQAGGLVGMGDLPGGRTESFATAVSSDGSVIVGIASTIPSGAEYEAFRWSQAGGMIGLGDLPGGAFSSRALGVSGDGNTVVGWSTTDTLPHGLRNDPFRWSPFEGMVSLGVLPGGVPGGAAWHANGNGAAIVGACNGSPGDAFRWTPADGMKKVRDLLVAAGVSNLSTWSLREARAVSHDGTVIAGNGVNPSGRPEGWVARLPLPAMAQAFSVSGQGVVAHAAWIPIGRTPSAVAIGQFAGSPRLDIAVASAQDNQVTIYQNNSCAADFDGNGQVQPADVAAFVNAWAVSLQQGTLFGDFDGNGQVQPADVALFVNAWANALATGC
jgi:probable HAF family extracellular repeat protein